MPGSIAHERGERPESLEASVLAHQPQPDERRSLALQWHRPGKAPWRNRPAETDFDVREADEGRFDLSALQKRVRESQAERPVEAVAGAAGQHHGARRHRSIVRIRGDANAVFVHTDTLRPAAAAKLGTGANGLLREVRVERAAVDHDG